MNERTVVENEAPDEGCQHSSGRGRAMWPISVCPAPRPGASLQNPTLTQEGLWGRSLGLCLRCKWGVRRTFPERHKGPT